MDQEYGPLYQQAQRLQHEVYDALADHAHPQAVMLRNEMQYLLADIEVRKNPRDIEDRLRTIQNTMHQARSNPDNGFINYDHANQFHRTFEQLGLGMRRFSNYS